MATGVTPSLRGRIGRVASASAVALVFGEAVTLVQTVALARLLSPAEVGIFMAGTVITLFLGNFVEGGLRSGLVQREHQVPEAAETVFWATAGTGLLMSVVTLLTAPVVGLAFDSAEIGAVAAASSGVLFLFSLTNVPEAVLQREFSVWRRVVVGPSVSVTFALVAVCGALAGWGVWSMVAGLYASYVAWLVTLWSITDWRPRRARASYRIWRELARYGLPLVVGSIGARIQQVMEALVVGRGLSEAALGQFRYGQRIAQIPGRAIVEVGAIALFPAFSRLAGEPARLRLAFLRSLRWSVTGAAALTGLMLALGVPSVTVVLGEQWREAGVVVTAMAGLGVGKALTSVSEEVIKGGGRTRRLTWYFAVELVLGVVSLLALTLWLGLVGVGLSVSLTAVVVGVTCLGLSADVVGVRARELAAAVVPPLPCAAVATAACWALEHLVLHSDDRHLLLALLFLTVDTVVFGLVYLAALGVVTPWTARGVLGAVRLVAGRVLPGGPR